MDTFIAGDVIFLWGLSVLCVWGVLRAVTGRITKRVGLRVGKKTTGPSPPMKPTLNSGNVGVVRFYGRFGTEARSGTNGVLPIMVACCTSGSFSFIMGAPPITVRLLRTSGRGDNSTRPGHGGVTRVS